MGKLVAASVVLWAALSACNDPFALKAQFTNTVDTLDLYAVNGTALNLPSAYQLYTKSPIRPGIDQPRLGAAAPPFDFLYRIDAAAGPQLAPFAAVAPAGADTTDNGKAGFRIPTLGFDEIKEADQVGYVTKKPMNVAVGTVLLARSGLPNGCGLAIPYYAKLEVISIDPDQRSVRFRIVTDNNCGYRGLELGLPTK